MKRRILPYIGYLSLVVIAVFVTVFLYWIYSPPKEGVTVSPSPIPVVNKTVSKDGFVILNYTSCKNTTVAGRVVTTQVGDNIQLTFPVASEKGDRECRTNRVPFPIHPLSMPGTYHLHFRATYKINPITTIVQDFDSESFKVE